MGKRKASSTFDDDVCPMDIDWDASKENVVKAVKKPRKTSKENVAKVVKKPRKTYIPKAVKIKVWANAFGLNVGQTACPVCNFNVISQMNFHCGHIVAEAEGGATNVSNLRPICAPCNLSMGKKNLNKFHEKYFK